MKLETLKRRLPWPALIHPAIVLLLLVAPAAAVPVKQQITLTVDTIFNSVGFPTSQVHRLFDAVPAIGNSYFATFDVDHTLLLIDGVRIPGVLSNLFLDMEGLIWDQTARMEFRGFRAPSSGFTQDIQDVTIINGAIFEMVAGWFGSGDATFVDLLDATFGGTHRWRAKDVSDISVGGFYSITQVPQTSALVLVLVGALLIVVLAPLWAPRNARL